MLSPPVEHQRRNPEKGTPKYGTATPSMGNYKEEPKESKTVLSWSHHNNGPKRGNGKVRFGRFALGNLGNATASWRLPNLFGLSPKGQMPRPCLGFKGHQQEHRSHCRGPPIDKGFIKFAFPLGCVIPGGMMSIPFYTMGKRD